MFVAIGLIIFGAPMNMLFIVNGTIFLEKYWDLRSLKYKVTHM